MLMTERCNISFCNQVQPEYIIWLHNSGMNCMYRHGISFNKNLLLAVYIFPHTLELIQSEAQPLKRSCQPGDFYSEEEV